MNKNIFKRLFVALGIIITLCLMVLPVKAAGLTATTSSVNGSKGDSVTITVTLSEKVNVISGAISFEYDKNALSLTAGSFNVPGATLANWDQAKELGAFMFMGGGDVSGTIFSATFAIRLTPPKVIIAVSTIIIAPKIILYSEIPPKTSIEERAVTSKAAATLVTILLT